MAKDRPAKELDKYIVRLPDGMRERIADAAHANGRSMNSEIVLRLQQSFEKGLTPPGEDDPEAVAALEAVLRGFRVLAKHPTVAERLHKQFRFEEDEDNEK